jgi:hypothetical protein
VGEAVSVLLVWDVVRVLPRFGVVSMLASFASPTSFLCLPGDFFAFVGVFVSDAAVSSRIGVNSFFSFATFVSFKTTEGVRERDARVLLVSVTSVTSSASSPHSRLERRVDTLASDGVREREGVFWKSPASLSVFLRRDGDLLTLDVDEVLVLAGDAAARFAGVLRLSSLSFA